MNNNFCLSDWLSYYFLYDTFMVLLHHFSSLTAPVLSKLIILKRTARILLKNVSKTDWTIILRAKPLLILL